MGQKVNPIGFRLGVNRDWRSRWYASPQELPAFLHSDLEIRSYVKKKLQYAAVSKIAVDYGFAEANTVYGKIGVKCWICKKEEPVPQPASPPPPPAPAPEPTAV